MVPQWKGIHRYRKKQQRSPAGTPSTTKGPDEIIRRGPRGGERGGEQQTTKESRPVQSVGRRRAHLEAGNAIEPRSFACEARSPSSAAGAASPTACPQAFAGPAACSNRLAIWERQGKAGNDATGMVTDTG